MLTVIVTTVNSLFCIGDRWIDRTFEAVVSCEKTTVGTGDLMHFFGLSDHIQNAANQTPTAKAQNRKSSNYTQLKQ